MYTRNGQTDRRTDGETKAKLTAPFPTGDGVKIRMVWLPDEKVCEMITRFDKIHERDGQQD